MIGSARPGNCRISALDRAGFAGPGTPCAGPRLPLKIDGSDTSAGDSPVSARYLGGSVMGRVTPRRLLQTSGAAGMAAQSGGLAALLTGRAPVDTQATSFV